MSARSFTLDKKRQGNITVTKTEVDGSTHYQIVLHDTAVVQSNAAGGFILSTGGWNTPTTRTAINRALNLLGSVYGVSQRKGKLYLVDSQAKPVVEFYDGMCVRE